MQIDKIAVGQHARDRFVERFNEAKAWTDAHPNVLTKEMLKYFNQAEFIGSTGPNDNSKGEVEMYVFEDMLFFFDTYRKKLVTFVMIDFGFISEINKQICTEQIKYIKELLYLMNETEEANRIQKDELEVEMIGIDNEIDQLQTEINAYKARRKLLVDEIDVLDQSFNSIQKQYKKEVQKVQYSINFRIPDPQYDPQLH